MKGKLSRPVLRGGGNRKAASLPDYLITTYRVVTIDENAGFENTKEYNGCEDKHETTN
jgi:hypothetical protein